MNKTNYVILGMFIGALMGVIAHAWCTDSLTGTDVSEAVPMQPVIIDDIEFDGSLIEDWPPVNISWSYAFLDVDNGVNVVYEEISGDGNARLMRTKFTKYTGGWENPEALTPWYPERSIEKSQEEGK